MRFLHESAPVREQGVPKNNEKREGRRYNNEIERGGRHEGEEQRDQRKQEGPAEKPDGEEEVEEGEEEQVGRFDFPRGKVCFEGDDPSVSALRPRPAASA